MSINEKEIFKRFLSFLSVNDLHVTSRRQSNINIKQTFAEIVKDTSTQKNNGINCEISEINKQNYASKERTKNQNRTTDNYITIKNIDNPAAFKNPILLQTKLQKYYINPRNAYIMPFGDLRIWFNTEKEALEAATVDVKATFREKSVVIFSKPSANKIAIYKIPQSLTEEDIKSNLEGQNIEVSNITFTKKLLITQDIKTAFITLKKLETKTMILKEGKIRIGCTLFPVANYIPKIRVQCYKCQKFGHIARTCKSQTDKCARC